MSRYARRSTVGGGTLKARLTAVWATHYAGTPLAPDDKAGNVADWLAAGAPLILDASDAELAVVEEWRASQV